MDFKLKLELNNSISKLICLIYIIFSLISLSESLYEDQIGKFDWKINYVGKLKSGYFDVSLNGRIIVATEENVLASISAKSGDILWRQVFENSPRGNIKYLYVNKDTKSVITSNSNVQSNDIYTVSGYNPAIIRTWNSNTGNLVSEWSLTPNSPDKAENSFWFYYQNYLYHVIPVWQSHLEVTAYNPTTGQQKKLTTMKITTSWINENNCVLAEPFYACYVKNQILAVDLTSSEESNLVSKIMENEIMGPIKPIKNLESTILVGGKIVPLKDNKFSSSVRLDSSVYIEKSINNNNILVQAYVEDQILKITSSILETGQNYPDLQSEIRYPNFLGLPEIHSIKCITKPENQQVLCRLLISTEDGAMLLVQQGKIKWIREESLTNIAAVEMIDLPLSDAEGAIENELNNKEGNIYAAFYRRLSGQVVHFKNLVLHVIGLGPPPSATQRAGLVRDSFGLHKIIVVLTSTGKMFGIDNISGKHHWVNYLPEFTNFKNGQSMKLLIQRTSKHFPNPPQCGIVGVSKKTGYGILYQFNPVTGQPINDGVINLNFHIQQISLTHETGPEFLQGILFLDTNNKPHVIPESLAKYADKFYMYTANKDTGVLSGFLIEYKNNKLTSTIAWQLSLGGSSNTQKIIAVAPKNSIEHVHSQGRVLGDRSVLYKYINPNLIIVATHGLDSIHKYILNIHLIDVVSGAIVSSLSHRRVKEPFHLIHSENWLAYSYYNEKVRRTEITSVELYEGKTQTNSTAWSSLEAPPMPMVERQAYIFPSTISFLKETITEKGITNKHVLIGLTNGGLLEMPWTLLDPRRPVTMINMPREEGIIPYIPELPIPQEHIINYNQSIANIKGIYTAPSGLESTCLVFAYGLDIFVTRVAPSKTFDLLKEDFDYFLISVVLIALTTSSYVVKHLSSRKALKQAWK